MMKYLSYSEIAPENIFLIQVLMKNLNALKTRLKEFSDLKSAEEVKRFFKTGEGGYSENDVFLGISVPSQRQLVKDYYDLELVDLVELLNSEIHEERFSALLVLVFQYQRAAKTCDKLMQKRIFDFYCKYSERINNWDLVDVSAAKIVGHFLFCGAVGKEALEAKSKILEYSKSKNLWQRRIAVVSMHYFIKEESFEMPLKIIDILLEDSHDLIQKANGWMLREIGKKDLNVLNNYLMKNYPKMPRTTLRYAIERHAEDIRKRILKGDFYLLEKK